MNAISYCSGNKSSESISFILLYIHWFCSFMQPKLNNEDMNEIQRKVGKLMDVKSRHVVEIQLNP